MLHVRPDRASRLIQGPQRGRHAQTENHQARKAKQNNNNRVQTWRRGMGHGLAAARGRLAHRGCPRTPPPLALAGGACSCGDSSTAMPTPSAAASGVFGCAAEVGRWALDGDATRGAARCSEAGGARGIIARVVAGESRWAGGAAFFAGPAGKAAGVACALPVSAAVSASAGLDGSHSWLQRLGDGVLPVSGVATGGGSGSICTISGACAGCVESGAVVGRGGVLATAARTTLLAKVAGGPGHCCCAARLASETSSCIRARINSAFAPFPELATAGFYQ